MTFQPYQHPEYPLAVRVACHIANNLHDQPLSVIWERDTLVRKLNTENGFITKVLLYDLNLTQRVRDELNNTPEQRPEYCMCVIDGLFPDYHTEQIVCLSEPNGMEEKFVEHDYGDLY